MTSDLILQIIPATGWSAVYLQDDGTLLAEPLVAWALMDVKDDDDEEPFRAVEGLSPEGGLATPANRYDNFIGYAWAGEDLASVKWQEAVRGHLEAKAVIRSIRAQKEGDA